MRVDFLTKKGDNYIMKMSKRLQEKIQSITEEEFKEAWDNRFKDNDPIIQWYYKNTQESRDALNSKDYHKVLELCVEAWEMYLKYLDEEDSLDSSTYGTLKSYTHSNAFLREIKHIHSDLPYYIAIIELDCNKDTTALFINMIITALKGINNNNITPLTQNRKKAIKVAYKGWCDKNEYEEIYEELFDESPF